MPSSTMWTAVLQATAISTVSLIVTHHAGNRMFSDFFEDPAMMNFTAHFTNSTTPVNALNLTIEKAPTGQATYDRLHGAAVQDASKEGSDEAHELPFKVTITNSTALDETISAAREQEEPFYTRELPLGILTSFIMCALQYCWLIGLERALPARSRRRDVIVADKGEMSEDREEEVVKKWIAQGRVRRASLNWCNTFLKWILSLTIGRVWWFTVEFVVYRSLRLESPRKTWGDMLRVVTINYAGSFFMSITPLVELIAFVAIPAYKQIVFVAGADLACQIFFVTVAGKFASWAVQTELVQGMIKNGTETMVRERERQERYARFANEL